MEKDEKPTENLEQDHTENETIKKEKIKKPKQPMSTKDKILISVFSVIIGLSVLSVLGVFLLNSNFFLNKDVNSGDDGKIDNDLLTPTDIKSKCVNFLVCGIDYAEGTGRGKLTDVVMVASFDIEGKNIDVLQIPRDTFIGDDYPTGKINAIYGQKNNGGVEGLARRINKMFDLTIDHYATINMDSFKVIVDKIGGVEVDVPHSFELEGVTINKGLQTLDGIHAERFVRERKSYAAGDLERNRMQQIFLKALINKLFAMPKTQVVSLAPTLMKQVTTDLTLADMMGYYTKLMSVDKNSAIRFHSLPVTGGHTRSVLIPKRQETADILNEHFRPYSPKVPAEKLGIYELDSSSRSITSNQQSSKTVSNHTSSKNTTSPSSKPISVSSKNDDGMSNESDPITSVSPSSSNPNETDVDAPINSSTDSNSSATIE
ncbi:LCP family protein [Paludicola sp. MB14-C6]|uniref:LCP family protein n=1 Tax=Paludihabitans sp. MB14-C6 TaxID=3070656 RepID=UPI0027DD8970|nr:LCP family protein [Paludicola sp. MB14-C6]WMJ23677.1 LCP family protein [Paludicola sp. MB14-C6]